MTVKEQTEIDHYSDPTYRIEQSSESLGDSGDSWAVVSVDYEGNEETIALLTTETFAERVVVMLLQ